MIINIMKKGLAYLLAIVLVTTMAIPALAIEPMADTVIVYGSEWRLRVEGNVTILTPPTGWRHPGNTQGQHTGWRPSTPGWELRLVDWDPSPAGNIPRLMTAENALDAKIRLINISNGSLVDFMGQIANGLITGGVLNDLFLGLVEDLLDPDDLAAMLKDHLAGFVEDMLDNLAVNIVHISIAGTLLEFDLSEIVSGAVFHFLLGEQARDNNGALLFNNNGNPVHPDSALKAVLEHEQFVYDVISTLLSDARIVSPITDWFADMIGESYAMRYWRDGNPTTGSLLGHWNTGTQSWNSGIIQLAQGGMITIELIDSLIKGDISGFIDIDIIELADIIERVDLNIVLEHTLDAVLETSLEHVYFYLDMGMAYAMTIAYNGAIDLLNDSMGRNGLVDDLGRNREFSRLNFDDHAIDIWQWRPVDFIADFLPSDHPDFNRRGEGLRAADNVMAAIEDGFGRIADTIIFELIGNDLDMIIAYVTVATSIGGMLGDLLGSFGVDSNLDQYVDDLLQYLKSLTECRLYGCISIGSGVTMSASCYVDGSKIEICSVCDRIMTSQTLPATGHNIQTTAREATCANNGFVRTGCVNHTCTYLISFYETPLRQHNNATRNTATCTEPGHMERYCQYDDCGHFSLIPILTPALGHNWDCWDVTTPAECDADGEETRDCANCGEAETKPIPALTHNWGDWGVTAPAECDADGEETRNCTNCGETETKPIPALTHNWGQWEATAPAECDADGEETRQCANCDKAETKPIPAPGCECNDNTVLNSGGGGATENDNGDSLGNGDATGNDTENSPGNGDATGNDTENSPGNGDTTENDNGCNGCGTCADCDPPCECGACATCKPTSNDTPGGNNNDDRSSPGGGGGGGRAPVTINAPAVPLSVTTWLEQGAASLTNGSTRNTGMFGVRANAWAMMSGQRFSHSTLVGNAVQIRISVNDPALFTKDALLSAWLKGAAADRTRDFFGRWFSNQIRVLAFDQQTDWEHPVQIAAKVDLTGMNTTNLHFYAYNQTTNSFRLITSPEYRIDSNGFLHFTTPFAGSIVISENALVRK